MRLLYTLMLITSLPLMSNGQTGRLDSLKQVQRRQASAVRIKTLLSIAYELYEYNIQDAHNYALQALDLARRINDPLSEKHALSLVGEYYYNINNSKAARNFFLQSDKIRRLKGGETYAAYNYTLWANSFAQEAQYDSAQYYFSLAIPLLATSDNYLIQHYGQIGYAAFLMDQYKLDEARKTLELAYVQANQANSVESQADVLIEMARLENISDNYPKAMEILAKANALLPDTGYSYLRLMYFYYLGYVEYNRGNFFTAITQLREVLSAKEVDQYDDIKANLNALIGKIYLERGEFNLALKADLDAQKVMESLNMRKELGQLYCDIAWLYFKQFNDQEAESFVNKAMGVGYALKDELLLARAHSIHGSILSANQKLPEAIKEHEIALAKRTAANSRFGIAESNYNLGTVYENMGRLDQALFYANKSLEIDEKLGNILNLGLSYKKLAALTLKKGKLGLSKKFLLKADSCAQKSSSMELKRDVYLLQASWYEQSGNLHAAINSLRSAIQSNDSMYNFVSLEKNAEIRGLFDLENIELRSKQKEQELALQDVEMAGQKRQFLLVSIILVLVSFMLVIGAIMYRISRKHNKKLLTEIAERKKAQEQMALTQMKYEEAQALAHVGSWELNLNTKDLIWSAETYRIFEIENFPPSQLYDQWLNMCHKDDIPKLMIAVNNTLKTGEPYYIEHRIITKDGRTKYLYCLGDVHRDAKGNAIGLRGTNQDITLQKQAAMAKSEFLSTMSHEIRTPINGVIGIANLLMEENLTKTQRDYVNTLHFSAQNLSSIVTDILDFSKIESGSFTLEKLPFDLHEVAFNVYKLFKNKAKEKNLKFDFLPEMQFHSKLLGDYVRLSQVLSNLIANAIKFTEAGVVTFQYSVKEEQNDTVTAIFTILDSGIGISEQHLEKIFDNFSQADISITRRYGGTGLGLSISKKLIEMQGGTITVSSKLGKGSLFTVVLNFEKETKLADNATAIGIATEEETLSDLRILVAEDNKINVMVLAPFLKKWGAVFDVAEDGSIALDLLQKNQYDAVIMDIQMPVMDGKEATKKIRESQNNNIRNIPVIAFTAEASIDSHKELLSSGFNDCVTKPFQPETLFNVLKQYHKSNLTIAENTL